MCEEMKEQKTCCIKSQVKKIVDNEKTMTVFFWIMVGLLVLLALKPSILVVGSGNGNGNHSANTGV